jgi:hypothetical protein
MNGPFCDVANRRELGAANEFRRLVDERRETEPPWARRRLGARGRHRRGRRVEFGRDRGDLVRGRLGVLLRQHGFDEIRRFVAHEVDGQEADRFERAFALVGERDLALDVPAVRLAKAHRHPTIADAADRQHRGTRRRGRHRRKVELALDRGAHVGRFEPRGSWVDVERELGALGLRGRRVGARTVNTGARCEKRAGGEGNEPASGSSDVHWSSLPRSSMLRRARASLRR